MSIRAPGPNREAIRLYREICRTCKRFYWPNEKGEIWGKILQENARKEFEEARYEKDPLIVARLLVVGRDSLLQVQYKYDMGQKKIVERINSETRRDA